MVVHTCNPSTWQHILQFEVSLGYTGGLYLEKKENKTKQNYFK
jgi:hypothetical protein